MENDTNADEGCQWYQNRSHAVAIFGDFVMTPIYFVFGGLGHFICLIAFFRQRKEESAYTYQLFVVISETIEIMTYTGYTVSFYWFSGIEGGGADWFRSCYSCMWYTARLSTPLVNMFITSSLFFSVSIAADRIFALSKPLLHRAIDHKRHQAVAFVSCYVIGVATSLFDINRFRVAETSAFYEIVSNDEYVSSQLAFVGAWVRNALRIFGVLALILCNVTLLVSYHLRIKKKVGDVVRTCDAAQERRKNTERMLLLLAVLDSLLNASGMALLILYYSVVYAAPTFFSCAGPFYTALVDGAVQFLDIGDFYLAFAVSKQFRQMVFQLPIFARLIKKPQTAASTTPVVKVNPAPRR